MLSAPFLPLAAHQRSVFGDLGGTSKSRYYNRPAFLLAPDSPEGIAHYGSTSVRERGMADSMVKTSLYDSSMGPDASKSHGPLVTHGSRRPRSPYAHLLRSSRGLLQGRYSERRSLRGMNGRDVELHSTAYTLAHDPFPSPSLPH